MRKWFVYIKKSYEKDYPENNVIASPKFNPYSYKGEETDMTVIDVNNGCLRKVARVVGLGHSDFKDEGDFDERFLEVVKKKMREIGLEQKEVDENG